MNELLHNPAFINAASFFIFVALAFVYGRKPLLHWLDGEIAKIRNELHAAHHLRAEAEAALAVCKEKQALAEAEAYSILEMAKKQVEAMRAKAEADLAATLAHHEKMATERIRLAETQAFADVRNAAIDAAMTIACKNIAENMPDTDATKLIDEAIAGIPALKATKPKAA
jgi:F-type H+-transporting ATPase subunit b